MKRFLTLAAAVSVGTAFAVNARQLLWDEERPELVAAYKVYESATVPVAWSFVVSTQEQVAEVVFDAPQKFFTVTAVGFDGVEVPQIFERGQIFEQELTEGTERGIQTTKALRTPRMMQ